MRRAKAKANVYAWVVRADEMYVAARFLHWKGFRWEFALLGAHAIELYLKAFLIHKTGKYPVTHDLSKLYEECMAYDDFFKEKYLRQQFLLLDHTSIYWKETWTTYTDVLRYPEPLDSKPRRKGAKFIIGADAGLYQTLDCIAHFVKEVVPRPKEAPDVIDELINGDGYRWGENLIHLPSNLHEIREVFLHKNQYFKSKLD